MQLSVCLHNVETERIVVMINHKRGYYCYVSTKDSVGVEFPDSPGCYIVFWHRTYRSALGRRMRAQEEGFEAEVWCCMCGLPAESCSCLHPRTGRQEPWPKADTFRQTINVYGTQFQGDFMRVKEGVLCTSLTRRTSYFKPWGNPMAFPSPQAAAENFWDRVLVPEEERSWA